MNAERSQQRPKNLARSPFPLSRVVRRMANDELRRCHEFRIENIISGPSLCHGGTNSVSSQISARPLRSLTHPRVMKQILLRVPPMVAEVFLCERLEP